MSAVEIIGLILAIFILIKYLPTLLFFNAMKNKFRGLERVTDESIRYIFWAILIVFIIFSAVLISSVGLLTLIVSGIVFGLFYSLFILSKPSIYRALIKEILRQSNSWLRWISVIGVVIGILLLYNILKF